MKITLFWTINSTKLKKVVNIPIDPFIGLEISFKKVSCTIERIRYCEDTKEIHCYAEEEDYAFIEYEESAIECGFIRVEK